MNKLKGYALPVLSGLLLFFAFPSAGLSILAWSAFTPLLLSVRGTVPLESFRRGFAAGLVFYILSIRWVINAIHNYGGVSLAVSVLLLVALSGYLALYFGAFAWLTARVMDRRPNTWAWFAAAAWVSLELLRNYLITGFPWNLLGYSQGEHPLVIQVADFSGVYGVSFLVMLVNSVLAQGALAVKDKRFSSWALASSALALLVLMASLGYGRYKLSHPPREAGVLKAALVQGNIEQFHKWDPAFQNEVFDTYKRLTLEAAKAQPDIIVWPETATPFFFQDREKRAELFALARSARTYLMTGSPSVEEKDGRAVEFNSAYIISPSGEETGRYDKMHLVPFGEYVPLKKLLPFVDKLVVGIGDFGRGKEYTLLSAGRGTFGTAICFEAIFPELVRKFALRGADFLASITNDAWYGVSAAPYQHFDMAILRAVENRRTLVRVANTGVSGIILPSGAVPERTGIFTERILTGEVPLVREKTFYTRYGDVFAYACCIISAVFLVRRNKT